jgi:hypothetical protein
MAYKPFGIINIRRIAPQLGGVMKIKIAITFFLFALTIALANAAPLGLSGDNLPPEIKSALTTANASLAKPLPGDRLTWVPVEDFIAAMKFDPKTAAETKATLRKAIGYFLNGRVYLFSSQSIYRSLKEDTRECGCDMFNVVVSAVIVHEVTHGIDFNHGSVYNAETAHLKRLIARTKLDPTFGTRLAQERLGQYLRSIDRAAHKVAHEDSKK